MTAGAGRLARASSSVACDRCGGSGIEPGPGAGDAGDDRTAAEVLKEKLMRLRPEAVARVLGDQPGSINAEPFSEPLDGP